MYREMPDLSLWWRSFIPLKGELLFKNHFDKVFEHSCVASMRENNQPVMVKIPPLIFV